MDREEIEERLRGVSRELCVAFAARAALRVLPLLAFDPKPELQRDAFWYWQDEEKDQYLLTVLRANAIAVFVGSEGRANSELWRAADSDAAFAAASYPSYTSDAAADATYAAADAAYAAFVSHAVASDAVASASDAYKHNKILNIAKNFDSDLALITSKKPPSPQNFLHSPLFSALSKDELQAWQELWEAFSTAARARNAQFDIWLDWYQARVRGESISLDAQRLWLDYPREVAAQGPAAVNAYIASQLQQTALQPLNRVRSIFIGYGEAGKTSLIRALHEEDVVQGKEAMTPGIEIREWQGAGNGLTTHFWDFGGQVVAHATHQFFLRSSCLYVLVLSARGEINANEQAEYWLQHVQTYGEAAPVMIVGNKCDQASLHLDMASLTSKYPNIVGFYPLSCTQAASEQFKHKFAAFRTEFCAQLRAVGTCQVKFSTAQFQVLQAVRELSAVHSFLPREKFEELCVQHRVSDEGILNRAWLLDILDKLGIIIHFPQMRLTDDYVLNPRWLTYGVYTVIYAEQAYVSEEMVYALLSKEKIVDEQGRQLSYTRSKCRVIVDAMQRFKLCYPHPSKEGEWIIPSNLPTDMPASAQDFTVLKAAGLAYKVKFASFLPRHLMPQMIVEHHAAILANVVWQNGVGLDMPSLPARAMLQVDYQSRELCIWVQGAGARDCLAILRMALRAILDKVKLDYTEFIRLPSKATRHAMPSMTLEDWADFEHVEQHLKQGMPTFLSAKGMRYQLDDLRGQVFPENYQIVINGNANIINGEVENVSNQSIKISGNSTIHGSVVAAEKMENVQFNTQTNISPQQQIAQDIFKEISALQFPPEKQEDKNYLLNKAQVLLDESKKEKPGLRDVKNSVQEIRGVLEEVGVAVPVVTGLLAQAAALFGFSL